MLTTRRSVLAGILITPLAVMLGRMRPRGDVLLCRPQISWLGPSPDEFEMRRQEAEDFNRALQEILDDYKRQHNEFMYGTGENEPRGILTSRAKERWTFPS